MKTFLRRLEILNFLRSQHTVVSTDSIVNHLENSGHLDAHQNQTKSLFRLIQRDLSFLLGEKSDEASAETNKEQLTYDSFDEYDNDFGLCVEKGSGKSLLWKLSPYQQLTYDFERMPAFMALALTLSEKHLKQVLPSETRAELKKLFDNAQEKLVKSEQKLSSRHYQRLSQSVEFFQRGQRLQAASFNPKILDTIYRAILLGKRISISYQRGQASKEYELHPYGVVIMLPKLYLVAKKHEVVAKKHEASPDHEFFRSFLVHKIQDITIKQHTNHVPDNFNLRQYLDAGHMDVYLSFNDLDHHTLLLEITSSQNSNLIEDLKENPISPDQELQNINENIWQLTASVKRTIQLKNWLMALGNQAKVLSPKIIQEDLLQAIDAIRSRY
jgi:predicted DNA-binding transcriptional regulator YafY